MRRAWIVWLAAAAGVWPVSDRAAAPEPRRVSERLQAGDVMVRAVRAGRGDTTVVFLHGYGESLLAFREVFDLLAPRYKVVALDLPGFGLSDKPDGPYDLATMRWRLRDFLQRWTTGPVVVVGHSMGGQLAATLALDEPDRIAGVVLIAPAGHGLSVLADTFAGSARELIGWLDVVLGYILPLHDPTWLLESPEWSDYDPLLDPRYRWAATRVLEEFDFAALREHFDGVRQPTLLVWGLLDPTIPFGIGERLVTLLPCDRLLALPATLHRPHQTLPDTVAAEIERLLRDPPCR